MSNRGGFLEGLLLGALLGGLSILVASPRSRREIQSRIKDFKESNEDVFESTKETTEELIEKTKQSIESGFDRLGEIIKENQKVNADDILTKS
ncbi:MAG: hypothetical protein VXX85_08120 [Candidatus Margulisiibacteriota bacterium]|nr:hypothetical protein [Candidatus Margulisiibacteriota bacterium]